VAHACVSLVNVFAFFAGFSFSYVELIVIFKSSYCVILSSCPFFRLHDLNSDAENVYPKGSYLTIFNKPAPICG